MANYITVQDVRKEGVSSSIASDAKVTSSIVLWQQFIERATRQFFDKRTLVIDIDGNDSDTLFLPVPLVTITSLFMNEDFTNAVPTSDFRAYTARGPVMDDRRNPKIRLMRSTQLLGPGLFLGGRAVFVKGYRNQRISGAFGFVEPDDSTPALIKRAHLKLVVSDLTAQGGKGITGILSSSPGPVGGIVSETTDGHTIEYGDKTSSSGTSRVGLNDITGDEEVDKILELYRAPIAMGVPGSMAWLRG